MFKKLLFAFCALIMLSSVFADISIVTENSKTTYKQGEVYDIGTAQKGETAAINISSATNYQEIQAEWTQLQIVPESLPEGWSFTNSPENKKVLSAKVTISPNAKTSNYYEFKAKAVNSANLLEPEILRIRLKVEKGLLRIELPETVKTLEQGSRTEFKIALTNNSIAPHTLKIQSDLPGTWFNEQTITIQPGEKKDAILEVAPKVYGNHKFAFKITSMENSELLDLINVKMQVNPRLKDKYASAFEGLPFFSVTLMPYYLINSFLSLFLN